MSNPKAKQCYICPRNCIIQPGKRGFCNGRKNEDGVIICHNYGKVTALSLDPIEKKPLRRFMEGSSILSIGSYGCNFSCGFCQNNRISMSDGSDINIIETTPADIRDKAIETVDSGNMGIAYTYNEPLIGYEFVKDCAELIKDAGLKNVVVSNGYTNEEPLKEILPYIDAANIDLKAFNDTFYKQIGGSLEDVKKSISLYAEACHLEITCLIIPGENDDEKEIESMCKWIAGINKNIPLHLSRFFPTYKYSRREETSRAIIDNLYDIALQYLSYVYKGNY